jgi:hypothetical protein
MGPKGTQYTVALREAARLIRAQGEEHEALERVVSLALDAVPVFDDAGIGNLVTTGELEARVATSDRVHLLLRAESDSGDGPCLAAIRDDEMVMLEHVRHDQRWPGYVGTAADAGVQSQLALRLDVESGDGAGCLTFYSTSSEGIPDESVDVARSFATLAGLALTQMREVSELKQALASRKTIGMAIGLLMERLGMDEESAFAYLVRRSSESNTKLRKVAAAIVDSSNVNEPTADLPARSPGAVAPMPASGPVRPEPSDHYPEDGLRGSRAGRVRR